MPGLNTNNMALLRLADKLVREGDHQGALTAILKARQMDPANRYAEAYEERVRSLLPGVAGADPGSPDDSPGDPPTTAAPCSRLAEIVALLDQANTAIARADFPEALDYIGRARQLDPENGDICALEEQVRGACDSASPTSTESLQDFEIVRSTLEAYTSEAMELTATGEYEEALHLVTKGFILDPTNEYLREAERHIIAARQIAEAHDEALAFAAEHYQRLLERERTLREEFARHLDCARTLFRNGAYDDALTEIALGYTADPGNEELQTVERAVWQAKGASPSQAEYSARHEEMERIIRLHILAAEEFSKNGDFIRALDGLAKAYVLDPANKDIKRAEVRIRQAELRHHQASGSPLKLVYHHDRVVNGE
jgi:tetratricopeptide (TPR) repeat protein